MVTKYYWTNNCYENGRVNFQPYAYQRVSQAEVCSGAGDSYAYDALGRVTKTTHARDYNQLRIHRAGDAGDGREWSQPDCAGRWVGPAHCSLRDHGDCVQGVSPVNCGLDIAGTGFLTTYAYSTDSSKSNALKVAVTQGAQTRSFETDSLGRTISVVEPESGTTTYSYAYSATAAWD